MSASLLTSVTACLLPRDQREAVLGDLLEEGVRPGSLASLLALLGVAAHFHVEAWRDERGRLGALLSLTLGFALWWAVSASGWTPGEFQPLLLDPLSRVAIAFWSEAHVPAALGAGLLVGHAPWIPAVSGPARWHVAAALAVVAGSAGPAGGGLFPPVLLLAAAWIGDRGRRAPDRSSTPTLS